MLASVADWLLGLPGWAGALAVFAFPALEASAFIGFVFPGEIAVLLGGVLAYQHRLSLGVALAAAIGGAIVGDTVGYEIGRRHGRRLLDRTIGRLVRAEHIDRAERYLAERGGKAVLLGRFTAVFRALVPGLAGMSGMRYRTFAVYNAIGGAVWAGGFVIAGYLAGQSWRTAAHVAGRASLVLLLFVAAVACVMLGARWTMRSQRRIADLVDTQLHRPLIARLARRFERQLAFVARRLRPGEVRGLAMTVGLVLLVLLGWAFAALTRTVTGGRTTHIDVAVFDWFATHREPWLTGVMKVATALGSSAVLIPVVVVVGIALWRSRRSILPSVVLMAAYAGAELLFRTLKELSRRQRPPAALAVAHFGGLAFPSGHATLSMAVWGAVALTVTATGTWRRRVLALAASVIVSVGVGITRLYLGAHWLTDVAGGWMLGLAWLTTVMLVMGRRWTSGLRS